MNGPQNDPLLLGLAAGDERAFAMTYDRYAARMYRSALAIVGRREDAEDAVQDVFMSLVRCREKLCGVSDLAAYLFAALHRAAYRCARRTRSAPTPTLRIDDAEAPLALTAAEQPDWRRLRQAIGSLPQEQREVVALKIDGELTFAQIAEVLGVSLNTAASRYRYALQKLRASLVCREALLEGTGTVPIFARAKMGLSPLANRGTL